MKPRRWVGLRASSFRYCLFDGGEDGELRIELWLVVTLRWQALGHVLTYGEGDKLDPDLYGTCSAC